MGENDIWKNTGLIQNQLKSAQATDSDWRD